MLTGLEVKKMLQEIFPEKKAPPKVELSPKFQKLVNLAKKYTSNEIPPQS